MNALPGLAARNLSSSVLHVGQVHNPAVHGRLVRLEIEDQWAVLDYLGGGPGPARLMSWAILAPSSSP